MTTTDSSANKFEKPCDDIFGLGPNIQFVGVINRIGKLVAEDMGKGLQSLEGTEHSSKLLICSYASM